MRELDIDLADRTPRRLTDDLARWGDVLVTMGCGDRCPYIPGSSTSTGSSKTRRAGL